MSANLLEETTSGPCEAQRLDADTHDKILVYLDGTVRMGGTDYFIVKGTHDDGRPADVCHTGNGPRSAANAHLFALAHDHALLLAALTAGKARFMGDSLEVLRGDMWTRFAAQRRATDPFGCPLLTPELRKALAP